MDLTRLVVVSPHCDDAVLASGDLIAAHPSATVVTIFTVGPREPWLRGWDRDCGFVPDDDVMRIRREEDREALTLLGARPVWLPFRDAQYGGDTGETEIAAALGRAIDAARATAVAIPLGLFHSDHALAHDAALRARARRADVAWFAYADAIYRALPGDLVQARLATLRAAGISAAPILRVERDASPLKARAVRCYRSQLRGLATAGRSGHADAFRPEEYWALL